MHPDSETTEPEPLAGRNAHDPLKSSLSSYELWDAMREDGCPICLLIARFDERYLRDVFYDFNSDNLRPDLHASLGFCPRFLRVAAMRPDSVAFSRLYGSLSEDVARRLREREVWRLAPRQSCPLERRDAQLAADYTYEFAAHYGDSEFQELHEDGFGLCLGHLDEVLHKLKNPALRDRFLACEERKFSRLTDDLHRFVGGQNYHAGDSADPNAWFRAFRKFSRSEPPLKRWPTWWPAFRDFVRKTWAKNIKQIKRMLAPNDVKERGKCAR